MTKHFIFTSEIKLTFYIFNTLYSWTTKSMFLHDNDHYHILLIFFRIFFIFLGVW